VRSLAGGVDCSQTKKAGQLPKDGRMKIKRRIEILIQTSRVIRVSGGNRDLTAICPECPFVERGEALEESKTITGLKLPHPEAGPAGSMERVVEWLPIEKGANPVSETSSIEDVRGGSTMKEEAAAEDSNSIVPTRNKIRWLFFLVLPILFLMSPSVASAHITQLIPSSVPAGGPDLRLTILGEDLSPLDHVLWNGTRLESILQGGGLVANVPRALTSSPGTARVSLEGFDEILIFTIGPPGCNYVITPDRLGFDYREQSFTLRITVQEGCPWEVGSTLNWIVFTVTKDPGATENGSVEVHVSQNMGSFRSGFLVVAGHNIPIWQTTQFDDNCLMTLCSAIPGTCSSSSSPGKPLSTMRRFRDDVLSRSSRGRRYTELYYRFTSEAVSIAALNPSLILRTREMIDRYKPILDSLLVGEQVTLSSGDLEEIDGLLQSFARKGSEKLRECIKGLGEDLHDPQVHSEFNITIVDGPKRLLPTPTFGSLVRNTGTIVAPFGVLLLFVNSIKKTRFVLSPLGIVQPGRRNTSRRIICGAVAILLVVCGLSPAATLRSRNTATSLNKNKSSSATAVVPSQLETLASCPHLLSSTFFGGVGTEEGNNIAIDQQGNIYIAGFTDSRNFPLSVAAQPTFGGKQDAFVTKLDPSGSRVLYSTYLGGNGQDNATGIAVDQAGNAYVTGFTDSTNFPTKNAFQSLISGDADAFVAKLDPEGRLVASTLLGGTASDYGSCIAVDPSGNIYVAGISTSFDLTTVNPIQGSLAGLTDAFVAKIDSGNRLVYSTYLGGGALDAATGLAVDGSGNVYVTGLTSSLDFHTVNPIQPNHGGGGFDAFAMKLNPAGTKAIYATYLGGSGEDRAFRVALDSSGSAYITGDTDSTNFPVVSAAQRRLGGTADAFVSKLSPSGTELVYSTYLGGSGIDGGAAITVDATGNASVCGFTVSPNFPVSNPFQQMPGGHYDAFVTKLTPSGSSFSYSTFLGGSGIDSAFGIASDSAGNSYVMGITASQNFPIVSAFQSVNAGGEADLFVTRISAGPVVTAAVLEGKRLIVSGSGFDDGAKILVDGEKQKTANDEANPDGILIGKKAGKFITAGSTVTIQVRNSNGSVSNSLLFTRP
jgi:hypothetical protein